MVSAALEIYSFSCAIFFIASQVVALNNRAQWSILYLRSSLVALSI